MNYLEDEVGADFLEDLDGLHQIAKLGLWCWVVGTETFTWSKQLFAIMGFDPGTYTPTLESTFRNIHPDDRDATMARLLDAVRDRQSYEREFRVIRSDGTERICWSKVRPVVKNDVVVQVRGVCLDITYLRQTEAAVRDSEADYRNMIELSPQMPWTADARGRLLSVSSRFTAMTGISAERALTHGWYNVIHPKDVASAIALIGQSISAGQPLDHRYRVRCAEGDYRWLRTRAYPKRNEAGHIVRWYGLSEDIHDQVEAECRLAESEEHHRYAVELSPNIPWTAGPDGALLEVGPHWLALTGTTSDQALGSGWLKSIHPDDLGATDRDWSESLSSGEPLDCTYRIKLKTGDYSWVRVRARPRRVADGRIIRWYGAVEDIQERVEAQSALLKAEERYRLATQATNDLIWDHDLVAQTIEWNESHDRLFGYAFAELGREASWWEDRIHPDDRRRVLDELARTIAGEGTHFASEYRFARQDGTYAAVVDRGYIVRTAEGPVRAVGAMQDLSERKAAEERVLWTATHDALTRLPNRSMFNDGLAECLAEASSTGRKFGLLHLDVDHFKQINDSLGHDAGDALLQMFAERLRSVVRSSDVVARLGGDEFAVLLPGVSDAQDVHRRANAILDRMREPFTYAGNILDCRASIGASIYPQHGNTPEELLKSADIALYSAKAAGRGGLMVFQSAMRLEMQKRSSMISLARDALRDDTIRPYYQPKIDYGTDGLSGFEALLRWRHPTRGIQPPQSIQAAFEDLELAAAVSDRMIEMVISDMRRWLDDGVEFGHVAVNASAAEFRRNNFAERVLERLARSSIPTRHFQLEVTETVFLGRGSEYVDRALKLLSSQGVKIALDDFGTGYASLRHLKQFPVDIIKIDQSFVRSMEANADDEAIIRAVINLGKSLDISVVAEGIETELQDGRLRQLGCDVGQGFLYSKAVAASRLAALVERLAQRSAGPAALQAA